jgi:hypothetical protein
MIDCAHVAALHGRGSTHCVHDDIVDEFSTMLTEQAVERSMNEIPDVTVLALTDLLRLRRAIDTEITARGHARTSTSLEGELMERVVADAYGGELQRPGQKSSDVALPDGTQIQVKMRSLPEGVLRHWTFKDFEFDLAVVISIDRDTSSIIWARELSRDEAVALARPHAAGGWRIRMARARTSGVDVTERLRDAFSRLR